MYVASQRPGGWGTMERRRMKDSETFLWGMWPGASHYYLEHEIPLLNDPGEEEERQGAHGSEGTTWQG